MGEIADADDGAERVAVVGFDSPADGGFVDFGDRVEVIEQSRGGFDEDEKQALGERVEGAAVADFGGFSGFILRGGLDDVLDHREAGGAGGFVEKMDAGGHGIVIIG